MGPSVETTSVCVEPRRAAPRPRAEGVCYGSHVRSDRPSVWRRQPVMAVVARVPVTTPEVSPFKGRTWTAPADAATPPADAPASAQRAVVPATPTPPSTPSPAKRARAKGRGGVRPRTAGSTAGPWQPPSPWLSGRVEWSRTTAGTPSRGRRHRAGPKRPQSAPAPTAAEGAALSPRVQGVDDLLAQGSDLFLGSEHERVQHYRNELHNAERQRREREAMLRRLRDESHALTVAVGAVVPTTVARLVELELQLDQAFQRQHAQGMATNKAAARIKTLRQKLPRSQQRVVARRQELAMVTEEVGQRGEALAEASNVARQARSTLAEVQERVARERGARQLELTTLHSKLGVDALVQEIQELERKLQELDEPAIALKQLRERTKGRERQIEGLREREREQRAETAALLTKRKTFESSRRDAGEAKQMLDALRLRAAKVDDDVAARRAELDDIQQLADQRDACAAQLAEAQEVLAASKDGTLRTKKESLHKHHQTMTERHAEHQETHDRHRTAAADAETKEAHLRQKLQDEDAAVAKARTDIEAKLSALRLSAATARQTVASTEAVLETTMKSLRENAVKNGALDAPLADAKSRVAELHEEAHRLRVLLGKQNEDHIRANLDRIQSQLADLRGKHGEMTAEHDVVHSQTEFALGLADQLADEKAQLSAAQSREDKLHTEEERAQADIARLEEEIATAKANAAVEQPRLETLRSRLEEHTASIEAHEAAVQADVDHGEKMQAEVLKHLSQIDVRHLEELRSMPHPPAGVELTMAGVLLILGKGSTTTWLDAKRVLHEPNFIREVLDFTQNKDTRLSKKAVDTLSVYVGNESFDEDRVAHASSVAGPLCSWVKAQAFLAQALARVRSLHADREQMHETLAQQREEYETALRVVEMGTPEALAEKNRELELLCAGLAPRATELARLAKAKPLHAEAVTRLQTEYEGACNAQASHRTEASLKEQLDHMNGQLADLERDEQKHLADLHEVESLKEDVLDANSRLSDANDQVQEVLDCRAMLVEQREDTVAEHTRLEGVLTEARSAANTAESEASALAARLDHLESNHSDSRAKIDTEMQAHRFLIDESGQAASEAHAALSELAANLEEAHSALQGATTLLMMQSSLEARLEKQHNGELSAVVATLTDRVELLRSQADEQRDKATVEAELQALLKLPYEMAQPIADAEAKFAALHAQAEKDTKIADEIDASVAAAKADSAAISCTIEQLYADIDQDGKASAALTKTIKAGERQEEKIQAQLERLQGELELKAHNRPAEVDQTTGTILPPHQSHFDPRWTEGAPVGKTERLRCLSAGPSPNRPPAAWATSFAQRSGGGTGALRDHAMDAMEDSARHKLLAQAWQAMTHATGMMSEEEITARLLAHSEERERLRESVGVLEEQRTSLRDSLLHWRQELLDLMYSSDGGNSVQQPAPVTGGPGNGGGGGRSGRSGGGGGGRSSRSAGEEERLREKLREAEARLQSTDARLGSWMTLLAEAGPGLEHLVRSCGPEVLEDFGGVNVRDVTGDDDLEALLAMAERRVCFVLASLEGSGLNVQPGALKSPTWAMKSAKSKGHKVVQGRAQRGGSKQAGKGGKIKHDTNVRVPSRAALEQRLAAAGGARRGRSGRASVPGGS